MIPVRNGGLVDVISAKGSVRLARIIQARLLPSPMGCHAGSDKHALIRRYDPKAKIWRKPAPVALADIVHVWPKRDGKALLPRVRVVDNLRMSN